MAANQPNPAEVLWGQTLLVGHCPAHNGGMGVGWWRMGATPLSHCDSLPVTAAGLPNIIPHPFQHLLSSSEQPISSFSKSIPILYPRPLLLFCSGDKHATMRGGWSGWLVLAGAEYTISPSAKSFSILYPPLFFSGGKEATISIAKPFMRCRLL